MLSADSTSLMLAADRALPARDHPRTRLTVTGIKLLVTLYCTQGRQARLSGKEEEREKEKKDALPALAGANPRALSREILGRHYKYERATTFHAPIPV